MIHGLDTGFMVAAEVREHAEHADARDTLARLLSAGDLIAIAPQVLGVLGACTCITPKTSAASP